MRLYKIMNSNLFTGMERDQIALIQAFAESARRLNFTEAADKLAITPSTLGRRVKRLEQYLGVDLFVRTTRKVALTEAGNIYFKYCSAILRQLEEADTVAKSMGKNPAGLLRVSVPSTFGKLYITPNLPVFLDKYPDIDLDINFTDHFVDLIEQRIDVSIRIGALNDSTLRAKLLAPNIRRLVASPDYLDNAPVLKRPEDIEKHSTLHFSYLNGNETWTLKSNQTTQTVTVKPYIRSNDALALYEAVLAGKGIAILADFITLPALKEGRLVPVLDDWKVPETGIYVIYASSGFLPNKIRVFIDFLSELLKDKVLK